MISSSNDASDIKVTTVHDIPSTLSSTDVDVSCDQKPLAPNQNTLTKNNTSSALFQQYLKTRQHTENLCSPLHTEDYIPQAADFVSPPKWHLAHTTWFFEEMILTKYFDQYQVFDEYFGFLFNSYYQSVGERAIRAQRGLMTRPTVQQVYDYRQYVDQYMQALCEQVLSHELSQLITLGINHEQQHQELLLTDLKYNFSMNPTDPVYQANANLVNDHNSETAWVSMREGIYDIGHASDGFCFDNELGRHKVYLHDYQISQSLVTNGEFIAFIESGGYQEYQHWLDEGWAWVSTENICHPLYWQKEGGEWYYYTLAGRQRVNPDAILCHVSYYEANAYAHWKKMRLPTEFEWEAASPYFQWGKRWEWTSSAYQPYPQFSISDGAVGEYNGKFMVNQMVLRGASVATSEHHSRPTYRNFFHPFFQWQFSGIRLVQ